MNEHDLWVNNSGILRSDPDGAPVDAQLALKLVAGQSPMALTTNVDDRDRLIHLYNHKSVLIEPSARSMIQRALSESTTIAPPLMQPTDYELVAYVDEVKELTAKVTVNTGKLALTAGRKYSFRRASPKYHLPFVRKKMHYSAKDDSSYSMEHDMLLVGRDSAFIFYDDRRRQKMFRDHTNEEENIYEIPEAIIWNLFEKPKVPSIAEKMPEKYQDNLDRLEIHELTYGFEFYPGQREYVASVACADSAAVCAETGCGKTVIAIGLICLKNSKRSLVVAPKGTVKDADGNETTYDPAQWVKEFKQFAPEMPVYSLFSEADYRKILKENYGELPAGVYVSYDHAMFRTRAFEQIPNSWAKAKVEEKFRKRYASELRPLGYKPFDEFSLADDALKQKVRVSEGIGEMNHHGIKCIYKPSLATVIGDIWDMVILDEAHLICNLDSQVTQNVIRMQPRYKYALSATPIPNMVWNIFSIMGWLCVPEWYKGGKMNPRWPYSREMIGAFKRTFVSHEKDLTQEAINRKNGRGPAATKASPIISEPTRLLKLLRPTVAFLSKEMCNPTLMPCEVMDIRVPMGYEQRSLYTHYLDIANIPYTDPRLKYGVQLAYLRGICADPSGVDYGQGMCSSNYNPKMVAILETIYKCLERGEQVIHVSARHGMTNEIEKRLDSAGIRTSRIDGTVKDHAKEASMFKRGEAPVMLMGINCAQAYSFENCQNLIVGSLEWSYGKFSQAKGRVWRLNSPKPVKVYVILHEDSIEEAMFDKLANKEDAAVICLRGERVPRDVVTMTAQEILAEHIEGWDKTSARMEPVESETEASWEEMQDKLLASSVVAA